LRKYEHFRKREVLGKSGTPNFTVVEIGRNIWGGAKLFFSKNKNLNLHDNSSIFFTDI
jgi:hypothetical protein